MYSIYIVFVRLLTAQVIFIIYQTKGKDELIDFKIKTTDELNKLRNDQKKILNEKNNFEKKVNLLFQIIELTRINEQL